VICGAESWNEMEDYAYSKEDFLRSFLDLPNGIPSHDTFNRVFSNIDSSQFEACSIEWVSVLAQLNPPDGAYGGQPGGFVIETSHHRLYIAGDTALTYDMKLIPDVIGDLDLAVLPIGDNFTMGVDEAIKASTFLGCNKVLGVHFDTFGYIKIDHNEAITKFKKAKKELFLLPIGDNLKL